MAEWERHPPLLEQGQCLHKPRKLQPGIAAVVLLIRRGKMGESPFADEMGKGVDPFNLPQDRPVLSLAVIGQADPGHAGVDFDVDPYHYPRGGGGLVQLGGIFPVEYGLGNAEPARFAASEGGV